MNKETVTYVVGCDCAGQPIVVTHNCKCEEKTPESDFIFFHDF